MLMNHPKLVVEKRTVLGKNVKRLRKAGILPANVYGKEIPSLSLQVPTKDFTSIYSEAGTSSLVDIELDGKLTPVLIHEVTRHPVSGDFLHADFFQVNLKEKIATMVRIELTGESPAVTENIGMLLQPLQEVEIEALPENLPESITVDVTKLAAVDDQITVADLTMPTGVTILTDSAQVVVKIDELVSVEAKEDAAAEEAAKAEEEKTEGAEGEAKPEGEEPEKSDKPTEEEKPKE